MVKKILLCLAGMFAVILVGAGYGYVPVMWQNGGSNLVVATKVNCSTNMTCSSSGSTVTLTAAGGSGSPGGSNTQVQYNNVGAFGGLANIVSDGSGYASLPGASEPSAPSSGVTLWSHDRGGMSFPVVKPEQGTSIVLHRADWSIDQSIVRPVHGATGTTVPNQFGIVLAAAVGTVSNPAPNLAGNVFTQSTRVTLTSAATANSGSEWKGTQLNYGFGNATTFAGGFLFVWRGGFSAIPANFRSFIGMQGSVAALSVSAAPTASLNALYFGNDAAQTTLRFCGNDGAGTATCTDCGASFPTNSTTALYEMMIFVKPAGSVAYFYANRLDSAVTACSGSISAAADIPASSQGLTPHVFCNNGGTAAACAIDTILIYLEKDI
jgi:hypothetical protein